LTEADLSSVILEAVASRPTEAQRASIALVLYLSLRSSKRIAATAAETLATQLTRVLQPFTTTHHVYWKRNARLSGGGLGVQRLDRYTSGQLRAKFD
jgi:Tfp pilus assembly PilM family ATPase